MFQKPWAEIPCCHSLDRRHAGLVDRLRFLLSVQGRAYAMLMPMQILDTIQGNEKVSA